MGVVVSVVVAFLVVVLIALVHSVTPAVAMVFVFVGKVALSLVHSLAVFVALAVACSWGLKAETRATKRTLPS